MARWKKERMKEAPDLDITAFLNLMVALVPFLLVSAVFSRITILELNMPAGAGGTAADQPKLTIEVIVRQDFLEIGDGRKVIARYAKIDNPDPESAIDRPQVYDLVKLTNYLLELKANYPDKTDSTILMEPDLEYRHLVDVMDAVRFVDIPRSGEAPPTGEGEALPGTDESSAQVTQSEPLFDRIELFPEISIGDAP